MNRPILALLLGIVVISSGCTGNPAHQGQQGNETGDAYYPRIDPSEFVNAIDNRLLSFTPGTTLVYESSTSRGNERTEIYTTNQTRLVMGVSATVVWDRVWLDGELIEDTKDWYAQDMDGNVWYFGEDSVTYSAGEPVSTEGSWEAGVDGAKPGIVMKAEPVAGDSYRQEYYEGHAEDMADVLSLDESVTVPYGSFTGCLKTRDWSPLSPGTFEYKYYCPEIGGMAAETDSEGNEMVGMIEIIRDEFNAPNDQEVQEPQDETEPEPEKTEITEEMAVQIAKSEVQGTVTDVTIESKLNRMVYVIEIYTSQGEIDVFVDIETGEIIGIYR